MFPAQRIANVHNSNIVFHIASLKSYFLINGEFTIMCLF